MSTCKTCQWWEPDSISPSAGVCRRYPLAMTPAYSRTREGYDVEGMSPNDANWPQTLAVDWCGEHALATAQRHGEGQS